MKKIKKTYCRKCMGTGEMPDSFTNDHFDTTCPRCGGEGKVPVKKK